MHTAPIRQLSLAETKKKIMDLLARRDHSEKELRQKLARRCSIEVIDQALLWARQQNWMPDDATLSKKLSEQMGRRGRGINKINQKLQQLGLKPTQANEQLELVKAHALIINKWSSDDFADLNFEDSLKLKAKILRYLLARGFSYASASTALKAMLTKNGLSAIFDTGIEDASGDIDHD